MRRKPPSRQYRDALRYACRVFTSRADEAVLLGKRICDLTLAELEAFCELAAKIDPRRLRPRRYRAGQR